MIVTSPEQVKSFLSANQYRMDMPQQYLGDEPNTYRKNFEDCTVRWLMFTCWAYEASAGNQAVPIVYKMINDAAPQYMADRFYLPSSVRDMRMLEKNNIGIFGIESKQPALNFDIVGTSISYAVLSVNLAKQLMMSGIPLRWKDRAETPEEYPMVIVGGQAYGNPEFLAPIVDCVYCGEVEDEPGNPGIAKLVQRIEDFKISGLWKSDRETAYKELAREFSHLYFPRFMDSVYGYEDRRDVGLEQPSKQIMGYRPNVLDMKVPIVKRHVKDLDAIPALTNPPLIYSDPGMGAGDLEVGRGCPAWCSFCALCLGGETEFITREGIKVLSECAGTTQEIWNGEAWQEAKIDQHGEDLLNTYTFAPAVQGGSRRPGEEHWKRSYNSYTVTHRATPTHGWPLADGGETRNLKPGDFVKAAAPQGDNSEEYRRGWGHGIVFGDGTKENSHGKDGHSYAVLVNTDQEHLLEQMKFPSETASSDYVRGFIEGWDAADGSDETRSEETCRIFSQHPDAEEWFRKNASYGGWNFIGVHTKKETETNYGTRKNPLKEYSLCKPRAWKVVDVKFSNVREPVYCAEVPGTHEWTLSSGVLTKNTFRQKPYRQRSVPYMVEFAEEFKKQVGSVHLAPFSPDFPMHTQRKKLIKELVEKVSDEVDSSSMRVDDFIADGEYIKIQVHSGMDSVTLGVEGNSQRLRDLVGKGASDEDVKEAVAKGLAAGIRKFKLYMISNLPGEDEGDIFRILKLAKELADIRDTMGKTKAQIQFSWTPLLIDPNTPFQWFAPPASARLLGEVWQEFAAINIDFRLGGKTEPNKLAFYQLAQRASREHGEALADVLELLVSVQGRAFWGGFPKATMKVGHANVSTSEALDMFMKERGFLNGSRDAWDERFKIDMFGWEFIDQGINPELLWITYQQMREFIEQTDSTSYDSHFKDDYHGNEWIERCDTKCYGKTCGACDVEDLQLRRKYINDSQDEIAVDLAKVKPIDERSIAMRVRVKVFKTPHEGKRFVMNDHWRFAFRRAAYQASDNLKTPFQITKRSIRFVSDKSKFKDFTAGVDYIEFGLTRFADQAQVQKWLVELDDILNEGIPGSRMAVDTDSFLLYPATSKALTRDVDLSFWELETEEESHRLHRAIKDFEAANYVKMIVKQDSSYGGVDREEVNAKDFCEGIWVVKDGSALKLRFLLRGRPTPYEFYAALMGKVSVIEASKYVAVRLEAFIKYDSDQMDFFRPSCEKYGTTIPFTPMQDPYHFQYSPKALDESRGLLV